MNYTVIVNIPMTINLHSQVYYSDSPSLKASDRSVCYPVLAYLDSNLTDKDTIRFILLVKKSEYSKWKQNISDFMDVMNEINNNINADISFITIDSEFAETGYVHEKLLNEIVDNIPDEARIIADITFGPKDLPIVVLNAIEFAERFLGCTIERILYGQVIFNDEGKPVNAQICDMSPLYALKSLTNAITETDRDRARKMLKAITSF